LKEEAGGDANLFFSAIEEWDLHGLLDAVVVIELLLLVGSGHSGSNGRDSHGNIAESLGILFNRCR
jgi:hypothetical protein